MPKILITGCSSGFGLAIAQLFLAQDWEVIATMRSPQASPLQASDKLTLMPLDVTDPASIAEVTKSAGPLDALVNNAGVGLLNALEGVEMAKAREVFETNTLGPIAVAQAFMPMFRSQGSGVIVNISSSVTVRPLPALSVYSASKAALNAFTESLALEAAEFGIRTRLVLPGAAPTTAFGKNAMARMGLEVPAPYEGFVADCMATLRSSTLVTVAQDVAEATWRAVTDPEAPMRLPAGADAVAEFRAAGWPLG